MSKYLILLSSILLLSVPVPACKAAEFGIADDKTVNISPALTASINFTLADLARKQNEDGSWSGNYGKNVGETSLCILAFMALGNLPGEGKYGSNVTRGVNWILEQSQASGLIQYTNQTKQAPAMYGHALSTLMLSEVWGQTRHKRGPKDVGNVLRKAADLIVQVQGPKGGWGYRSSPQDGDTSVCVMQMIALKSAQEAGIYVPDRTIEKAINLIKTRYDEKFGGYGYNSNRFRMNLAGSSAAGTCIMLITGEKEEKYTKRALESTMGLLEKHVKGEGAKPGHTNYYMYYTSVCAYAAGDKSFARWMKTAEPYLLKMRRGKGWATNAPYNAAFCVLAAALPYRYLPIYQR